MADKNDDVIPPIPVPPVEAVPAVPQPAPAVAPAPPTEPAPPAYVAPPVPTYAPQPVGPAQGLSISSMVCGIAGLFLAFFGIGLLAAIAAVITGHLAQKRQPYAKPFWLTGIITGYVGILFAMVTVVFWIVIAVVAVTSYNQYGY